MASLQARMCSCDELSCLDRVHRSMKTWWHELTAANGGRPPMLTPDEMTRSETIGAAAEACFYRTIRRDFLAAAAGFRVHMCAAGADVDAVADAMAAYEAEHERILERGTLRLSEDERLDAAQSVVAIARCLQDRRPGAVLERVPSLFKPWRYDDDS